MHEDFSISVDEVIQGAAGLYALAFVRTPAVDLLGQAADAAVADAQRPMHEELHFAAYGCADSADLLKGQLPFKDDS